MNSISREDSESDQEEGVVDYTNQRYDHTARISNGFKIDQLTEGIIFKPQELDPANNDQDVRYYSTRDPNDLVNMLEGRGLLEEDEDQNRAGVFEEMKKDMVDITPARDGGVLKRTLKQGVQSQPAVPEKAVVTIHYTFSLEGQDEPIDSSLLRGKAEKHKIGDGHLLEVGYKSRFQSILLFKFRVSRWGFGP